MAYEGQIASLQMGLSGLQTDDPATVALTNKLSRAENVTLFNGKIEKDYGSRKWNDTALPSSIKQFIDWRPDIATQRIIAVCEDGNVYRFRNNIVYDILSFESGSPATLLTSESVTMLECGSEESGNNRKLFIFTGKDQVQVINGDATTRRNIEKPPTDWTGRNHPTKGIVHNNRVFAIMGHNIYASSATDHEDFTTASIQFSVYPGESESLVDMFVYKSRLFLLKYPLGLYYLDDSPVNIAEWTVKRLNYDFGGSSPQCVIPVLDDVLVANNYGSLTSVVAADTFGDVQSADVISNMRIEDSIVEDFSLYGDNERHCLYYAKRKIAYITYRSLSGPLVNRILQINFKNKAPEAVIVTKDQPNCLGMIKDKSNTQRPYYGSSDGFIYEMLSEDRDVGGSAFKGSFDTQRMDFAEGDPIRAELEKQFDFVELVYEPTGDYRFYVEVWVDGELQETLEYYLKGKSTLNEIETDEGLISAKVPFSEMRAIRAQGRRIMLRCYNEGLRENFKICRINIYYKYSSNNQRVK